MNNDWTVQMSPESFPKCNGQVVNHMIKVINSPYNLNTESRYHGCASAENDVCYFIDDDFWPNHVEGLFASFVRAPEYLHSLTNADVYWNNLRWTAFSDEISPASRYTLHTGFSWVGSGSMVLKRNCLRFIQQMDYVNLSNEERGIADNFFSIWMNRIPYQLEVQLSTGELIQSFAYTSSPEIAEKLHQARNKALEILVANLNEKNPLFATDDNIFFSRIPLSSQYHLIKAIGLRGLFMTSVETYLPPYNELEIKSWVDRNPKQYQHEIPPENTIEFFVPRSYLAAVDEYATSWWESIRPVKKGDWFGLCLYHVAQPELIVIKANPFEMEFRVEISHSGSYWRDITDDVQITSHLIESPDFSQPGFEVERVKINLSKMRRKYWFQLVRVMFTKDRVKPLRVYDIYVR